jgi:phosphate starvation-inducible protein PhoH
MAKRREKVAENKRQENDFIQNPFLTTLPYNPDEYQKRYMSNIQKFTFTGVDAESGTGKTTLAVYQGFEHLRKGLVDKLVYMRFVDERYLKNGFLPGDLEEKERLLFYPFFDALEELGIPYKRFKFLKDQGIIELKTDTTERGRNRKGTFLIVDESQNAKQFSDLQLVFTRLHDERGKSVMIGHSGQLDNRNPERTPRQRLIPFQAYMIHMLKKPFSTQSFLVNNYRGEFSRHADRIMETVNEL